AQMVAALKKNGIPVWYVVGTNEGHGFAKKPNQDYLQAVEVEFLRRYLLSQSNEQPEQNRDRFPVSGMVRFSGRPIANGTIVFHPVQPSGHRASGAIREGRYTLTTIDPDDGALPGEYTVTIESRAEAKAGKLPARYSASTTTPLRCMIQTSANTIDFDLR